MKTKKNRPDTERLFSKAFIINPLISFSKNHDVVFTIFFGTFRAGSVPHISFPCFNTFLSRCFDKIFMPFSGIAEKPFVNTAVKFAAYLQVFSPGKGLSTAR